MNEIPLLSLCIPTANRWVPLKELLESVVSQVNLGVEIVVCDNGNDETQIEIKKYPVRYFKNNTNIGFDRNLLKTIEKSRGKYCWFLNDSSIIKENAIEYLLKHLEINSNVYITKAGYQLEKRYENGTFALDKEGLFGGKLNRVIVKKEMALVVDKIIRPGPGWIHMDIAMRLAINGPVCFLRDLHDPCRHLSSWAKVDGNLFFAHLNLLRIVNSWITFGYKKSIVNKSIVILNKQSIANTMRAKAYGLKVNYDVLVSAIEYKYTWPLLLIILITPSPVFYYIKVLYELCKMRKASKVS